MSERKGIINNRRGGKLIAGAIVFALLSACVPTHRSRTAATLDEVESYINERPDSALAVLRALSPQSLCGLALRARAALLHSMALDKCYIDLQTDSILAPAVAWYARHGSPDEKLKTLFYQGRILQNKGDLNSAAIAYSQAESYVERSSDSHTAALMYLAYGTIYNKVFNTQQELKYKSKGLQILKDTGDPLYSMALGELALVYHSMNEWAIADSLYKVSISNSKDYPVAMRTLLSNYARMLLLQPEPDPTSAIALLDRMQKEYGARLSIKDAGVYAYALELLGKRSVADGILQQLQTIPDDRKVLALPWLSRIAMHRGDYKSAFEYQDAADVFDREEVISSLSDSVTRALQEYYSSMANKERRSRIKVMWISLFLLLMLTNAVLLIIMRKKALESERDRLYEIHASLVKEMNDLEFRYEKLTTDYARSNMELSQERSKSEAGRLAVLSEKLNEAQERFQRERLSRFRQMGRLGSTVWQMDKNRIDEELAWKELKEQLGYIHQIQHGGKELVHRLDQELDGALSRMRRDLGLKGKPKEVLFLCCCILDMDPVFVSDVMGISVDNVYKKKSRYRAKVDELGKKEYVFLLSR